MAQQARAPEAFGLAPPAGPVDPAANPASAHAAGETLPAQREHVLVVDDEAIIQDIVDTALSPSGLQLTKVGSAAEAREALERQPFELILCDIRLPDESGIDLLRWCKERGIRAPLILISGYADMEVVIEALNQGASSFLEKPFPVQRLREEVQKALAARRCAALERDFKAHLQNNNRRLRQRVADAVAEHERLFLGSLAALARAVDARDPHTHQHSAVVARLAGETARTLGLNDTEVETARVAGMLHDLGKLAIPERILLKPAQLSAEEFALVKRHPDKSGEILSSVPGLEACVEAVRHHHEHFDGGGYPRGATGEAIPLLARIVSVCDAWDAMTSKRPYRAAMASGTAAQVIREHAGGQFDPHVASAFLAQQA